MKQKILTLIKDMKKKGISNIDLLALVTDTSYEVVFYGTYQGERIQSNEMAENGTIATNTVEDFYKQIATLVREASVYDAGKMNIVKCEKCGNVSISYDEKNCRVHRIKKEWKSSI